MREYGSVSPTFWTGDTGKKIRACGQAAQLVALYCVTAPGSNMIGLYYVSIPTIAHETGLTIQQVSKAISQLQELDFATYDHDAEIIWIRNMAKFQIGHLLSPKDKRIAWIKKELSKGGKSHLISRFIDFYSSAYHLADSDNKGPSKGLLVEPNVNPDGPSKGLESPLQGASQPFIQEQEQHQEQEHEQENTAPAGALAHGASDLFRFLQIWNLNCGSLSRVKELTDARAKKLCSRVNEKPAFEQEFAEAVKCAASTPFLCGDGDKGWQADFDWMIANDTNHVAVLEGKYNSAKKNMSSSSARGAYHSGDNSRFKRSPDFTVG